jgi:hypothetical protein
MNHSSDLHYDAQKDPDTLEREIDQTRAQMDQTLGALGRKLSPGQLIDEALGLFREHGGDFAANNTGDARGCGDWLDNICAKSPGIDELQF